MSMLRFLKGTPSAHSLAEAQRRIYASETTDNFRLIARFAKRSSYTLTSTDLASADLHSELSELGQFAEIAHGSLSPEFIWKNMAVLSQPGFPFDEYKALQGSILISAFRGSVSELQGYIAYRPQFQQLVIAFSGTSSIRQSLRNLDIRTVCYPKGDGCWVHSGFWQLYNGLRSRALGELSQASSKHIVQDIVVTGHSLGAVMAYLLALDIMQGSEAGNAAALPLTIAAFGSPRIGNAALVQYWRDTVADRALRRLPVKEYSVKGYNDGVPSLPPYHLGYRHFAENPLYFAQGYLYHIPATECESSSFSTGPHEADNPRQPWLEHPLGGHNYYNRRDMEKLQRSMKWFDSTKSGKIEWERYKEWLRKTENPEKLAR